MTQCHCETQCEKQPLQVLPGTMSFLLLSGICLHLSSLFTSTTLPSSHTQNGNCEKCPHDDKERWRRWVFQSIFTPPPTWILEVLWSWKSLLYYKRNIPRDLNHSICCTCLLSSRWTTVTQTNASQIYKISIALKPVWKHGNPLLFSYFLLLVRDHSWARKWDKNRKRRKSLKEYVWLMTYTYHSIMTHGMRGEGLDTAKHILIG